MTPEELKVWVNRDRPRLIFCQNYVQDTTQWYPGGIGKCDSCVNFKSNIKIPDWRDAMGIRFHELGGDCQRVCEFYEVDRVKLLEHSCERIQCGSNSCLQFLHGLITERANQRKECNCKNYVEVVFPPIQPELPYVTLKEVALVYWNNIEGDCEVASCADICKYFGIEEVECSGCDCDCGDPKCLVSIKNTVNTQRGY